MNGEIVHPLTRDEWRAWLAQNHSRTTGVYLTTYKKATGKPRVEYDEAVEEALAWGWVDSSTKSLDDERSLLWFSPRRKGSGWSRSNKERVERLEASGRMADPGRRVIEQARLDGSWTKLDAVENRVVPEDLKAVFDLFPRAAAFFEEFPPGEKRRILEWISQAKTPETRAKRVEETARLANENVRANLWKKKEPGPSSQE